MPFAIRNLSRLSYGNSFTLWHYNAGKDRLGAVCRGNYLKHAAEMLAVGDFLMITAADGAAIRVITAAEAGTVVMAPLS